MTTRLRSLLEAAQTLSNQEKLELIQRLSASLRHHDEAMGDGSADPDFWRSPTLETLAAEQAVAPVTNVRALTAAWWPDDETADDLIAFIRHQRRPVSDARRGCSSQIRDGSANWWL